MVLTLTVGAWLAIAQDAQRMPANGKWRVEYAEDRCLMHRVFDTGDGKVVTVVFEPSGGDVSMGMTILAPGEAGRRPWQAPYALNPSGPADRTLAVSLFMPTQNLTATQLTIDGLDPEIMARTTEWTVPIGPRRMGTLVVGSMAPVRKAMAACQRDLLQGWGVDVALQDQVVTPAKLLTRNGMVTSDDYPDGAIAQSLQTTTRLVWEISTQGTVENCRGVGHQEVAVFVKAGCAALQKRAKYTPALDKDGKPIASYSFRRIIWQIPGPRL